ncbi:MAG: ABC transporter ATP-binding protein [Oscillatoriales cyanobacterium RM2_1_1]|nr:ABC transporter ATP-binding protein [Oscillatoriales cyanobacterium SM2_3_0]NJO44639.1 ABC transporter ATP-binding protein [Oscillatoriales cyanobacterium RM2_1_1]
MIYSPILQLKGISKQFSGNPRPAVDNISLQLGPGDILGLLGPSGCGKTTLLRIIAGFEYPQQGIVEMAGNVISDGRNAIPPEQRGIGMVFQDYALFPHLTVARNIAFGLQPLKKISGRQMQLRIQEVLDLVSLSGLDHRYPHELSGGQQQRVALARALAPCPPVVLLDEPLSNLDVQVRLKLRQELREILKTAGTSAIFVTHDQEEALSISDWVAVMQQGRLEQFGTPEEIYQSPNSRFVAEFVTQANFIPAQRRDQVWHTELGNFAVEVYLEQLGCACVRPEPFNLAHFDQVELMIRQEDFSLQPDINGNALIRDRQFLGRDHYYGLQLPSGKSLMARTCTGKALPIGAQVQISVSPKAIRVFPACSQGSAFADSSSNLVQSHFLSEPTIDSPNRR